MNKGILTKTESLLIFTFFLLMSCSVNGKDNSSIDYNLGNTTIIELFENLEAFEKRYENYIPANLKEVSIEGITIKIFFGTWCHDSKRELPRALKILNKKENISEE